MEIANKTKIRGMYLGCPICGKGLNSNSASCCGESGIATWLDVDTCEPIDEYKPSAGESVEWEEKP